VASAGPSFKRSSHLVSYWNGGHFVVHNYATRTRTRVPPVVCELLAFFADWRPAADLFAAYSHIDRRSLERLLLLLAERSLLQRSDRPVTAADQAMDTWRDWNPAAGFFHNTTKDVRFFDLETIARVTREKLKHGPLPPVLKQYTGARRVRLPEVPLIGEFPAVLQARRTWRRFARRPLALEDLSSLVGLTSGVQSWIVSVNGEKVAVKTSPSGGARHSIELYVLIRRVTGVRRGLYHYAPADHQLQLVNRLARPVDSYLPTQWWYRPAAAVFFWTAVFAREQWRYSYPRAYRAVLIEAGHLCQTLCLTATWLGLAPFCSMALADSRLEHDLRLDGITESVLYAAGVGTRPADAAWGGRMLVGARPATIGGDQAKRFPGRTVIPSRSGRSKRTPSRRNH